MKSPSKLGIIAGRSPGDCNKFLEKHLETPTRKLVDSTPFLLLKKLDMREYGANGERNSGTENNMIPREKKAKNWYELWRS